MSLLPLAEWLGNTSGSIALHESQYMYAVLESVHVWALAVFVGFAVLLDLRLLGWALRDRPVSATAARLLPWTGGAFVVMVISGVLLFYAIPVRSYHSVFFRLKLVLLALAGINAWVFHATVWLKVGEWDVAPVTPRRARFAGAASLLLWACIIFSGRMIAYNWFDCDRQPQRAIVNWAAGCVVDPVTGEGTR